MSDDKLNAIGFHVNDIVTYDDEHCSSGGIVYRIVENFDPDARGRVGTKEFRGYIRIKPVFEFFATENGKNRPSMGTLVYHDIIRRSKRLTKVDVVVLGTKYLELGNFIRELAVNAGMEERR